MKINEDLKEELDKIKGLIKTNSKDAHFAEELIGKLLDTKGKMDIIPMPIGDLGNELDVFNGNTFTLKKYERGIVFHTYGGYSVAVKPSITSLYMYLSDLVDNQAMYNSLEGNEKEVFELNLQASVFCICTPMFAFTDADFTMKLATMVVQYLEGIQNTADNTELKEETYEKDESFKEASLALENIKDNLQ